MKKVILLVLFALALAGGGCAKINPRLDQKLDNQNGQIDSIKNNQNGFISEIGNLRQQQQLQNSQLKDVQDGYLNMKNQMFTRENSGVQILQGDGPLTMIFGLGVVGLILWHYRAAAKTSEKAADIMAQQIAQADDPALHERVFRSAMYSDAESHVYKLLMKYKRPG